MVVHEAFAEAHALQPGATISAILNGSKEELHVVGIVLSPEFVYALRPGELLPDDKRFGVLWMGQKELAAVFDLEGAFNNVSLAVTPNAIEQEVIQRLDGILAQYGGTGAYSRLDQSSHKVLSSELTQLRSMAIIFPMISLCVAGFLLHVVLSRMIATQREEIATLKAFGYTRTEIGIHYSKFLMVVLGLGILIGTVAGVWLARRFGRAICSLFSLSRIFVSADPRDGPDSVRAMCSGRDVGRLECRAKGRSTAACRRHETRATG